MKKTSKTIRIGDDLAEQIRNIKRDIQVEDPHKYVSDDHALRRLLKNKKGFIGDALSGMIYLFGLFLIISVAIFISVSFNSKFQDTSAPAGAKDISNNFIEQYPAKVGMFFAGAFVGLFLYTIITASLIDVISPIFFMLGAVSSVIFVIAAAIIKAIYGELITEALFATALPFIPGAVWFFGNLPFVAAAWTFFIAIVLYIKS